MIVETSALVAILLAEDGFEELVFRIAEQKVRLMSAASYMEASIVLLKRRDKGIEVELDSMIMRLGITIVPFTPEQAILGRQAHIRFGRGNHPAKLNLGDCFSYALAKQTGESLLFMGNDFAQTDFLLA